MRVFSPLMLALLSVDALAATGTLADLENTLPKAPIISSGARLSASEEARINAQLYERMMKMARSSREPSVINGYLELARKIKGGLNSGQDETVELQNRIDFYEELLRTLPANDIQADFYYELASSNDKLGKNERSVELLSQMLKRFPDTKYASEAHFRIAESYFARGKFADALKEYAQVLDDGNDRYWQQAQYQLAWTYYKDGRYEDAVKPFERLIDSLEAKYQLSKGEQLRLDDSYTTLSKVFVQLGGAPALASHYASRQLTENEIRIYRAVSDRYKEQQQPFDVAQTLEGFIQRHPLEPQTAVFNSELIKVYKDAGFAKDIIRVKNDYVQRFDTQGEFFQKSTPALQATLRPELKANLDDLAKHYHAVAQSGKSTSDYQKAADLYAKQLALATDPADQVRIRELMADALYGSQQYEAAIPVFEQLAYEQVGTKPVDSGYFALLAYQARLKQLPEAQQADWLAKQKASTLRFADRFSSDKNAAAVLLALTGQYLDRKDFATVSELSTRILKLPTLSSDDKKTASILLANAEFDQQQWANAERAYRQVLSLSGLSRDDTTRYQNQLAATLYRQADQAKNQDPTQASKLYQAASDMSQDNTVKVDAAWRAAMVTGETASAVPQLQAFYARYPTAEQANGILERIIGIQEQQRDWSGASRTYQQVYQRDRSTKPDNAMAALWLAADSERKATAGDALPRTTPISAAELALYRQYLAEPRATLTQSLEISERLYQDARLRRDPTTQQTELKQQLQWANQIDRAPATLQPRLRYLASRARTILDQPILDQYRAIAITQPLKQSIARKQAALQEVLNSQQSIIDLKVAEFVTQAQYNIGDSFNRFYQGVNTAPAPADMNELETEQYQIAIEEQTQPLKDKAIEWHKANAALATLPDGALWDTWIAQSFNALATLSSGYYKRDLHRLNIPASDAALLAAYAQYDAGQYDLALTSTQTVIDGLITAQSQALTASTQPASKTTKRKTGKDQPTTTSVDAINTQLAQAQLLRAQILMKMGQFKDADQVLHQAAVNANTMPDIPYTQAINLELYLKQPQAALDAYSRYLALVGTDKTVQKWVNLLQKQLKLPLTVFDKPVTAPADSSNSTTATPSADATAQGDTPATAATPATPAVVSDSAKETTP